MSLRAASYMVVAAVAVVVALIVLGFAVGVLYFRGQGGIVPYAAALCLTEKSYFCHQRAGKKFYSMSGHWMSTIFSRVSVA